MPDPSLAGRRILVVEDEFFLAMDLERELMEAGAAVAGPVASVDDALVLIGHEPLLDAAVLNVNLGGETAFPVAEKLRALGIPFLFVTGYTERDMPARWMSNPRVDKGIVGDLLILRIMQLIANAPAESVRGS